MFPDRLDQSSCPGGESAQEMRDRVDSVIAKVGALVAYSANLISVRFVSTTDNISKRVREHAMC